ncbi:MAG: nitrilase-related carbon-nitrogen hydrolase [Leptospirales bacterium]
MNTTLENNKSSNVLLLSKSVLLTLSAICILGAGMRWNIPIMGWLFPIPLLLYMRVGYKKSILLLVMLIAFVGQYLKITSEPLHIAIAAMAGIQAAIFTWIVLFIVEKIRHQLESRKQKYSEIIVSVSFASLITVGEYVIAQFSGLGVWGMIANTQLENLPLLQLASITGAYGISFLMCLTASMSESIIYSLTQGKSPTSRVLKAGMGVLVLNILVFSYGGIRLDFQGQGATMRVATVSAKDYSIQDISQTGDLGNKARNGNNNEVYDLIEKASNQKAEMVITNEGSIILNPGEEESFEEKIKQLALQKKVHIMAGYLIFNGLHEKFNNRLLFVDSEGRTFKYSKQFIVPGEPVTPEPGPILPITITHNSQQFIIGGAICYDFDSMKITNDHGDNEAGMVAIPSSDWRGIDPYHTQMTRLRGIEQGYSITRSVRGATSQMYDAYGRIRGSLPWHEDNDKILIASVPIEPIMTIYKTFGDWFVILNCISILFVGIVAFRKIKS